MTRWVRKLFFLSTFCKQVGSVEIEGSQVNSLVAEG